MTRTTIAPTVAVNERYDELFAVVEWWRAVDADGAIDDHHDDARGAVVAEARLLDDARLDEWLAGWNPDGLLWVPIDPLSHPARDQSYFLDDVRRLRERVQWRRQPSAWSQSPAAPTTRTVTNVESHETGAGELYVRSSFTVVEHRSAADRSWTGHQFHVLTAPSADGRRRRRIKVMCLPALRSAVPHPGVIL